MVQGYIILSFMIFAVDNGATIAITLALITLVGTVSAQLVTWHKIRMDSKTTNVQLENEQRRSDVEIAQNVMSQTVVVLNERLKTEHEANEERITALSALHTREIDALKAEHKRDVARLERKIDKITADLASSKLRNEELTAELLSLKNAREG
jgi:biopolymer transport protein ExbB/TolQ